MKLEKFKINSDQSCARDLKRIKELYLIHRHLRVSVIPGKDRSLEQNEKFHAMYRDLWMRGKFDSFNDARCYCKLMIGIPILKRDVEGFAKMFDGVFGKFPYEAHLRLMGPTPIHPNGFPVTSQFTLEQGQEYIEEIAHHDEFA